MDDIIFDADNLINLIGPASWDQHLKDDRKCQVLSLSRLLDCMKDSIVEPSEIESYVKNGSSYIVMRLLTLDLNFRFKNEKTLKKKMDETSEESLHRSCDTEDEMIWNSMKRMRPENRWSMYLLFRNKMDKVFDRLEALDQEGDF